MTDRYPSVDDLLALLSDVARLHEAVRVYSRLVAGTPHDPSPGSFLAGYAVIEAIVPIEKRFNTDRKPFSAKRGPGSGSGWPTEVYGALHWIRDAVDRILEAMNWQGLCEGKAIAYQINPGEENPRVEISGNTVWIYQDANTLRRPVIDPTVLAQLEEAARVLDRALVPVLSSPETSESTTLNARQREALRLIREYGPIVGKHLAKRLRISTTTLRRHVLPALRPYGVRNDRRGDGYYVAKPSE